MRRRCRWLVGFVLLGLCAWQHAALAADSPPQAKPPAVTPPAAAKPATDTPPVKPVKSLDELRSVETQVQRLVARALPAVVGIREGDSQGSGVIVTADGYIATAGHVIKKPGSEVTVVLSDGRECKATTLGFDRAVDSGLIKLNDKGPWPHVEMGSTAQLKTGSWCVAVGHPLGYREGRPPVVRIGRALTVLENVFSTDCVIVSGDSGGPVFDLDGKVLGINSRIGPLVTMNYHVPIDLYRRDWNRLVAKESLNADLPGKDTAEVKTPVRQVLAAARACVVRVRCDGQDAALGTIVGPDGWVVTKASELRGKITCRLDEKRELPATLVGVSTEYDLAMVKLEARGLPVLPWGQAKPSVGTWVASAGLDADPIALGIVGAPERRIPPPSGVLGVVVADGDGGVKIVAIQPKSQAEKAGLKAGDVITKIAGSPTPNRAALQTVLKVHHVGEKVKVSVRRDKQNLVLDAQLGQAMETLGSRRRDVINAAGIGMSRRRDDFPVVLQHDGVVQPTDCGGPLVDLQGTVVGINIARSGRSETFAIPTEPLLGLMYELMSGRLPPPVVKPAEAKPAPAAAAPANATPAPKAPPGEIKKPDDTKKPAEPSTKPSTPTAPAAKPSTPAPPMNPANPPKASSKPPAESPKPAASQPKPATPAPTTSPTKPK